MRLVFLTLSYLFFTGLSFAQPTTWNSTTPYTTGDLVVVSETGSSYIAVQPSTGVQPPDTTYWGDLATVAASKGIPEEDVPNNLTIEEILRELPNGPPDSNSSTIGTQSKARLINLSSRGYVGSGEQRFIGGFRLYGGDCKIIVRGFGPSRNNADNLDDPLLTWKTNPTSLPGAMGLLAL